MNPILLSIAFFVGIVLLAVLCEPLARRVRLPLSLVLVVAGFVVSESLVAAGLDLGIRWHHFHDLILYVLLPLLVFEAALKIPVSALWRDLFPVLALAVPLFLVGAGVSAVLLYFAIGHPEGFPWVAALLTGVLLSATDPAAVTDLLKRVGAPQRLTVLIEGESLFNDAVAIVLAGTLLAMALGTAQSSAAAVALDFLRVFFGGIGVGVVCGFVAALMFRHSAPSPARSAITLITPYSAFLLAEAVLHLSGVMAVLATGLWLSRALQRETLGERDFADRLWQFLAYLANAAVFVLVGVTITAVMFRSHWLAMLIGVGALTLSRAVVIYLGVPMLNRIPGVEPIGAGYRRLMFWGGVRGAVALALALSLPVTLDSWFTVQSIAYGTVLFTLAVQAPTMPLLWRRERRQPSTPG